MGKSSSRQSADTTTTSTYTTNYATNVTSGLSGKDANALLGQFSQYGLVLESNLAKDLNSRPQMQSYSPAAPFANAGPDMGNSGGNTPPKTDYTMYILIGGALLVSYFLFRR